MTDEHSRTCPKCGSMIQPDDRFCTACGARLEPDDALFRRPGTIPTPGAEQGVPEKPENSDWEGESFLPKSPLAAAKPPVLEQPEAESAPPEESAAMAEESAPKAERSAPAEPQGSQPMPKKKLRLKKWQLACAGLLVVAVIVTAIFFLFPSQSGGTTLPVLYAKGEQTFSHSRGQTVELSDNGTESWMLSVSEDQRCQLYLTINGTLFSTGKLYYDSPETGPMLVTEDPASNGVMSSDGKVVYYAASSGSEGSVLYRFDVESRTSEKVTEVESSSFSMEFSPDEKWMVLSSNCPLSVIEVESGELVYSGSITQDVLSVGNKEVYFTDTLDVASNRIGLFALPLQKDTEPRKIDEDVASCDITPEGEGYYLRMETEEIPAWELFEDDMKQADAKSKDGGYPLTTAAEWSIRFINKGDIQDFLVQLTLVDSDTITVQYEGIESSGTMDFQIQDDYTATATIDNGENGAYQYTLCSTVGENGMPAMKIEGKLLREAEEGKGSGVFGPNIGLYTAEMTPESVLRDEFREQLDGRSVTSSTCYLYYLKDGEGKRLYDKPVSGDIDYQYMLRSILAFPEDKKDGRKPYGVFQLGGNASSSKEKFLISEVLEFQHAFPEYGDLESFLSVVEENLLDDSPELGVLFTQGEQVWEVPEWTGSIVDIKLVDDTLYYVMSREEGDVYDIHMKTTGDLYSAKVTADGLTEHNKLDENVSMVMVDDQKQPLWIKDMEINPATGTLMSLGGEIASDVSCSLWPAYRENGLFYLENVKGQEGTLCLYQNGKKTQIAKHVRQFCEVGNGAVAFLQNVEENGAGDLMLWESSGAPVLLDSEVTFLCLDNPYAWAMRDTWYY